MPESTPSSNGPWVEEGTWCYEQYESFEAHIEPILDALRRSKSVAHAYLLVNPTKRFAAAPMGEMKVSPALCFLMFECILSLTGMVVRCRAKIGNIKSNGDRSVLLSKVTRAERKKAKARKAKRAAVRKPAPEKSAGEPVAEEEFAVSSSTHDALLFAVGGEGLKAGTLIGLRWTVLLGPGFLVPC